MKLSFSINGWDGYSWEDFVQTALEVGMQGIELRGVHGTPLDARGGPFHRIGDAGEPHHGQVVKVISKDGDLRRGDAKTL